MMTSENMNHYSTEKLSENNPLSLNHIFNIQKEFSNNLDKYDYCFAYLYREPKILCEETVKICTCHSITALPIYSFMSVEELRYLNYSKLKEKNIISTEYFMKSCKEAKYSNVEKFVNNDKPDYYINLLPQSEKIELQNYFRNFNFNSNNFPCFLNNYNHKNYSLYKKICESNSFNKLNINNYLVKDTIVNNTKNLSNPFSTITIGQNNNYNGNNTNNQLGGNNSSNSYQINNIPAQNSFGFGSNSVNKNNLQFNKNFSSNSIANTTSGIINNNYNSVNNKGFLSNLSDINKNIGNSNTISSKNINLFF